MGVFCCRSRDTSRIDPGNLGVQFPCMVIYEKPSWAHDESSGIKSRICEGQWYSCGFHETLATVISTILGGIGIIIYAQGFGFYQLYNAPLMMAFPAIAAVLIGGQHQAGLQSSMWSLERLCSRAC